MPTADVLAFADLLAVIPGPNPTGVNLRADPSPVSDYQMIREARKAARDSERLLQVPPDREEERTRIAPPDWGNVLKLGTKILTEKSKDLEVTAYVIESLVRLQRFPGLRDGYRLARELVEKYWEGLYPPPEDSDTESRFKLLLDLSGVGGPGALAVPIRNIPLTAETSLGSFNSTHYHQAKSVSQIADAKIRQKKIDDGAVTFETIQRAVAETPVKFYVELVEDITRSQEEFRRFCDTLRQKSEYDPQTSDLIGVLESYLDLIKDLARDKLPKAPPPKPSQPVPTEGPLQGQPPTGPVVDPSIIRDRNDAMDRLSKVAAFFREQEPQSIIPYALDQIVHWSKLPLPELLGELIPEEAARKNLFKQVGIKPPK
jgi:type VI secretion system protein ImpA